MKSCKDMFPKGDMRYLNHKNERNQLFNVYNIPWTFTSTESKIYALFSSILQKTHWISKGLSDLSKVKQLVSGKSGLQISIFWFQIQCSFFYSWLLVVNLNLLQRENPKSRIQSPGGALLTYLINEHMKLEDCKVPPGSILLWLFLRNNANEVEKETQVDNFMLLACPSSLGYEVRGSCPD